MSDQGIWFKLWCSSLDDSALDNLDIADFGRWAKLGAYTKKHGQGGTVAIASPARTLCSMLQVVDFSALHVLFCRLPNVETTCENDTVSGVTVATVTFKNWPKYQGDNSSERVRKFRERVTAKKRREEKRREETNTITPNGVIPLHHKSGAAAMAWAIEDAWLKNFLDSQQLLSAPSDALNDPHWWEKVAETVNGLTLPVLQQEFAKMGAWLNENPSRKPIKSHGWKRFIRGWLERNADRTRRYANGNQARAH